MSPAGMNATRWTRERGGRYGTIGGKARNGRGRVNRGAALAGDRVLMVNDDAPPIALNGFTGEFFGLP
jgi:hypothetical protein